MNIKINNQVVSKVENANYLGVVLDNKLSWNLPIAHVKKKTNIQSRWRSFKD